MHLQATPGLARCAMRRLLFIHLNVAVLRLAGLTADGLVLRPGFEDLAQRAGDWQARHTDSIWKDITETHSIKNNNNNNKWTTSTESVVYYRVSKELFRDELF